MAVFHCLTTARMGKNQPVWHWLPLWHCGSHFGLVGCSVFCRGCCFVVFLGQQLTCLALAASAAGPSLWLVVPWVFAVFCHGIAHSSAAFWSAIFVPQCCFMCHSTLCHCTDCFAMVAVFVHSIVLCAMAMWLVLWHCALCHNLGQCAVALHHVLLFCALCHFLCVMALHNVPQEMFFVPWHCA